MPELDLDRRDFLALFGIGAIGGLLTARETETLPGGIIGDDTPPARIVGEDRFVLGGTYAEAFELVAEQTLLVIPATGNVYAVGEGVVSVSGIDVSVGEYDSIVEAEGDVNRETLVFTTGGNSAVISP